MSVNSLHLRLLSAPPCLREVPRISEASEVRGERGMKIQCNACEAAEAKVLCCADEAALCASCDEKVHAANKLAGKHHRLPLLPAGQVSCADPHPTCDICQEAYGYFFCLEDRALLCRNCDLSIHTANPYVSAHQRFLFSGVRVGLEPIETVAFIPPEKLPPLGNIESTSQPGLNRTTSLAPNKEKNDYFYSQVSKDGGSIADCSVPYSSVPVVGSSDWPLEDFFEFSGYNHSYGFMEQGSSKADSGKFGSSDESQLCHSANEEMDSDDFLVKVSDMSWTVPQIPSPPTASGLHWQRSSHSRMFTTTAFVPDINSSPTAPSRAPAPTRRPRRY